MKLWYVWDRFGRLLGYVRAERKGFAMFCAERDLKAPVGFYVGRAD
jgi:hypothetical protein